MLSKHYQIPTTLRLISGLLLFSISLHAIPGQAEITSEKNSDETDLSEMYTPYLPPDIREDDVPLKVQRGDTVAVPVPISNPTLGTGLILGGAYFYPQTEAEKASQPASVTAAAGMYTSNGSYLYGIGQSNYWGGDKWRFSGMFGTTDLSLSLVSPSTESKQQVDWQLGGSFIFVRLSKRIANKWYLGGAIRVLDFTQELVFNSPSQVAEPEGVRAAGLGINLEHDRRDMPMNPYTGSFFRFSALFNNESLGSDSTYRNYKLNYSSYHSFKSPVVLAWQVKGCKNVKKSPLWDSCGLGLRGFAATDYLAKGTVTAQVEARWRLTPRWGVVGFAGVGHITDPYVSLVKQKTIPSYGVGLRFMVLKSKRINIRIDYGRSKDSDAFYLSVGEAF